MRRDIYTLLLGFAFTGLILVLFLMSGCLPLQNYQLCIMSDKSLDRKVAVVTNNTNSPVEGKIVCRRFSVVIPFRIPAYSTKTYSFYWEEEIEPDCRLSIEQ